MSNLLDRMVSAPGDSLIPLRTRLHQPGPRNWLRVPSTPLGLFALLLSLIFLVETTLMLVLPLFPVLQRYPALMVLLDSGLLVATLCPALWLLLLRPIRHLAHERGQLLREQLSIQERERARIARDLHDELGQVQTAILLTTRAARGGQTVQELQAHLDAIHGLASSAIESTRRLSKGLSPGVLEDFGLSVGLGRLIEDCNLVGGPLITLDCTLGDERFDAEVELVVYRVIQEALMNAVKHSGATQIAVNAKYDVSAICFSIVDNGSGMHEVEPSRGASGLGLRSMRERLELVRGTLSIHSSVGGGTTVAGRVPARTRAA